MAGPSFTHLFSPFEIRGLTFKNRIFSPAHGTSLGDNGRVGDDLIGYHKARAALPPASEAAVLVADADGGRAPTAVAEGFLGFWSPSGSGA